MEYGDKVVVWSDLHLGLRNNEKLHNTECQEFVKWMIEEAKEFGAKKSIFCGDFHHYRSSVQCNTLNFSVNIFKLLSSAFDMHYQIVGNHDLFYKNKREINSVEYCRGMANISLIDKITTEGIVTFAPWLVGDEFNKLTKINSPFIFSHLELPNFFMNSQIKMPDNGINNPNSFTGEDQHIFTGHFHKRQTQHNTSGTSITYLGNCFPHDFSDTWDDDRGIMLLEFGKPPIFKSWPNAPKYRVVNLSEVLQAPAMFIDDKTKIKIQVDINITQDESNFIKETLYRKFKPREMTFRPMEETPEEETTDISNAKFESIDQIIIEHLSTIESNMFSGKFLIDIYENI